MGMQRPSGIPVSNIMEVIFGNLSVLYVVKRFEAKIRDVRYGSVKSCGCWHRKKLDKNGYG